MGLKCKKCGYPIPDSVVVSEASSINGKKTSPEKTKAARKNGKNGGRPRGITCDPPRS